jgi:regulator of sigma E protease
MTVLLAVVAVLAISLLIVLHEAGHMWAARAAGMRVERFSVGFGPVIFSTRRGDTEYAVSALPLGGYVRIAGMSAEDGTPEGDPASFATKPLWRRALVLFAGPGANYLGAVLLAVLMAATLGVAAADPSARIGELVPGRPAEQAGLRPGDRILTVGGTPVSTWNELVTEVQRSPGRAVELRVVRGGEGPEETLTITPEDVGGVGKVGVRPFAVRVRRPIGQAIGEGFARTNEAFWGTATFLGRMITGRQKGDVAGVVGIADELVQSARVGLDRFLDMIWNLSVALALFNLLPIPALDGGRLVFLGVEAVTRRPVNARVEGIVNAVGFVLLIGLLVGVTVFKDLPRLLGR